jgi:hypothetical protein
LNRFIIRNTSRKETMGYTVLHRLIESAPNERASDFSAPTYVEEVPEPMPAAI